MTRNQAHQGLDFVVCVPLCDYEPIATRVWNRRLQRHLVGLCMTTWERHMAPGVRMYVLVDRCSPEFVSMARRRLRRFEASFIDNSSISEDLLPLELPDKTKHIANQLIRAFRLAEHADVMYFCEQDYLFRTDPIKHAAALFETHPEVDLLSPFDHPDRHNASTEPRLHRHRRFATPLSDWKDVSSTNGNFMWRMELYRQNKDWILDTIHAGGLDLALTGGLVGRGRLLAGPEKSLIQHFRLDGSNASPTFPRSPVLTATSWLYRMVWRPVTGRGRR